MRARLLLAAAVLAAALTACGAPDELSQADGTQLDVARDRIAAAAQTERRLADSPQAAERLLARVRRIVAGGALESRQLDEFGLAALGELHLAVPALARVDRQGVPRELDREALTTFLADATADPAAAMRPPAAAETQRILDILARTEPGPDTRIPVADTTADAYLADVAKRLRPTWPDLAARVDRARATL